MDDEFENIEKTKPSHPGTIIAALLMPSRGITKDELAKVLGLDTDGVDSVLEGRRDLTPDEYLRLEDAYGAVAQSLIRIQKFRAFFDEHGRRPNTEEKLALFGIPGPSSP